MEAARFPPWFQSSPSDSSLAQWPQSSLHLQEHQHFLYHLTPVYTKLWEQENTDLGYAAAKGEYVDMIKAAIIDHSNLSEPPPKCYTLNSDGALSTFGGTDAGVITDIDGNINTAYF